MFGAERSAIITPSDWPSKQNLGLRRQKLKISPQGSFTEEKILVRALRAPGSAEYAFSFSSVKTVKI